MTTEEKAKAYDEALERIWKELQKCGYTGCDTARQIYRYFPELKESEEERIRKEIITHCRNTRCVTEESAERIAKWIAWLEKQGEQKPNDKIKPKFKIEKGRWYVCTKDLLDNYANKAFYEGDAYVSTQDGCLIPCNSNVPFKVVCADTYFRDWTIEDAEDGDVLFQDFMCGKTFIYNGVNPDNAILYSFIISNDGEDVLPYHIGKPNTGIGYIEENKNIIRPATKEQRDLLFQKMKEAGYEWDSKKKELKIIDWSKHIKYETNSPSIIEENTMWSEEDERICQCLIRDQEDALDEVRNDKYGHSEIISDLKEMYRERIDWLKSLRPHN